MSFTGQCAETIQETIGAHYTLKFIKKENENAVSKAFCAVTQEIFSNLYTGMDKVAARNRALLRNTVIGDGFLNVYARDDGMSLYF